MRRLWWGFVRFFFRLLYNEFAWTYDLVAWVVSLGQWQAWGRTAIPSLRGERVLELAHGPGHLLVAMVGRGLSPVGLDLSSYMGRLARRRLSKNDGLAVPLVRARAQALPFRDGCFDSTVATFPAEFIMARDTLREVARVLAPGGRWVIVPGAVLSGRDPLSRFIWWLYQITGQGDVLLGRGRALLERAGFSVNATWEEAKRSQVLVVTAEKAR
ncbi:MAG: class I SAM-dependent methyltransferase [Anaerolineae bacterium]|nr:class I SAM-dependent methyltransferase [Anaerolineae bacterium]